MAEPVHAEIRVSGQVQGVGFRPFVYRLAHELGLAGWVRNDAAGVEIAVEGETPQVMRLIERLHSEPPVLARVDRIAHHMTEAQGLRGFTIAASAAGRIETRLTPDIAICADCLAELFDPADRRYRHAFISCIHCGPRYTLTARLPYDRANTSMATFLLCPACRREYEDPGSRRFHAQPNACPECGPHLALFDALWQRVPAADPVVAAAERIRAGQVVAIKGIGGFHLACDAHNAGTLEKLRGGKRREEKPFAVMVPGVRAARRYAEISQEEATLLESSERPIVLLRKSALCDAELPGIAPGLHRIGLMLPYTPLHYLLFHELHGRPSGAGWLGEESYLALVMTSANPGGEPLVKDDAEARTVLAGVADACLTHDRGILRRCDDSVMQLQNGAPVFVRRARGHAPQRIALPFSGPSVLACGASLKSTVCVTRGNEAFVSQHIGDLDHAGARVMLEETVADLCSLLGVRPEAVAHDLHPDFHSVRFAQAYARQRSLPLVPVQHHHAHIAAICADHHVTTPVLGLALDGMGLGADGAVWGGELMRVDCADAERLGQLAPMFMPGADRAAREPWRMAAAALFGMGRGDEIVRRFPREGAKAVADMLRRGVNCAPTSSMGRVFDAAAGLLGVREVQDYEGQAAMLLESVAARHGKAKALAHGYSVSEDGVLDFRPVLAALADCKDAAYGAALFHATVAEGLSAWVLRAAEGSAIDCVALAGGCFLNSLLSEALIALLAAQDMRALVARQLPPNDGAISLGQAAIALQRINQEG